MDDSPLLPFPDGWGRALVIAAHPDDVEWGTSAAVAAWTASGRSVTYLLVTRGEAGIADLAPEEAGPVREREQRVSAAAVGADIEFLGHADGTVEEGPPLRRELAAVIRRLQPEGVVTLQHGERWGDGPGAPWNSADHRAVGRAAVDAVADAANRWIFRDLDADGLQPWRGTRWIAIAASSRPTHAVGVAEHLDQATAALAAHARYLQALQPEDPDVYARRLVEGMAQAYAPRFGDQPCVPFELLDGPGATDG